MKTPHTNRRKRQNPKRGQGWCVCDRSYIGNDKKCPVCGCVNGIKRFTKTPPSIDEF